MTTADKPFFLYLAYNAPHAPLQATEKYLARFPQVKDPKRRAYMAMISAVDDGVGQVLDELDRRGIAKDTAVYFLSDNGGVVTHETGEQPVADNAPLRGGKSQLFEGGVRVPFAVRWPSKIAGGRDYERPVSSLDIFATLANELGLATRSGKPLDGVDITPYLAGTTKGDPHPALFWRKFDQHQGAMVIGDVKYIATPDGKAAFNLRTDIGETRNIAKQNVETMAKFDQLYAAWAGQMAPKPAFPPLGTWPAKGNAATAATAGKPAKPAEGGGRRSVKPASSRRRALAGLLALGAALGAFAPVRAGSGQAADRPSARTPNIVILYADDLGYGDLGSYGARRVATPHSDRLAARGLRFTDAYAPAATCTPSRYALLTGEYGFRSNAEILPGDAPALIRPGTTTIASVLKSRGYRTAVVGKWHLGLGGGTVDWNSRVAPGPKEIGFDYSFLLPATLDRVPTVYLEDQGVVGLDRADPISVSYAAPLPGRPVGREHPEMLRYKADDQHSDSIINGVSRIGYMRGGKSAEWVDEDIHTVLASKARGFIRDNRERPFFLYFPIPDPHVPRLPGKEFAGKTGMGPRGDAIVEMDWIVGQVMAELRAQGLERDTLVILSSDNGPVLNDGYEDGAVQQLGDHRPGGIYRGGKYSAFEAGTRVPLIAYWPGHIRPGTSPALLSHVDLLATCARLVKARLAPEQAIDSRNMLSALLGTDRKGRDYLFTESVPTRAIRSGAFKYIAPARYPATAAFIAGKGIEGGASASPQLYDLRRDPSERRNLASARPALAARLAAELRAVEARRIAEPARTGGLR
ncbi:sulfatase-like hydrolase/transferase [Novosphingobium sp. Gsoil 351]|uniref:sulfatase-like hydrolase/transferase n=1 Tax=Novosphingobium sp. Gsoil 351 TaxID=2675225 RepID=UPI0012B4D6E1|nr:sulfatase-like hydrolase/transferase [Novosphingobium sp. Gsoil 351]QGN54147.1 sulfatase-like hydrolase/transferase [Novosphingobium sp. Gsoil 351]